MSATNNPQMLTPHIIDKVLVIFNKVTNDYDITKKNPEFMLNVLHACIH